MKNIAFLISITLFLSCKSQKNTIERFPQRVVAENISNKKDLNYYLSSINIRKSSYESLFGGGVNLRIFTLVDPLSTSNKSITEETEEFFITYLISVTPDGDFYTQSKLYKIEGLIFPKIIEIQEDSYPDFSIKIEYGIFNDRKTKSFRFKGVK